MENSGKKRTEMSWMSLPLLNLFGRMGIRWGFNQLNEDVKPIKNCETSESVTHHQPHDRLKAMVGSQFLLVDVGANGWLFGASLNLLGASPAPDGMAIFVAMSLGNLPDLGCIPP